MRILFLFICSSIKSNVDFFFKYFMLICVVEEMLDIPFMLSMDNLCWMRHHIERMACRGAGKLISFADCHAHTAVQFVPFKSCPSYCAGIR